MILPPAASKRSVVQQEMTALQAVMGIIQLNPLRTFLEQR